MLTDIVNDDCLEMLSNAPRRSKPQHQKYYLDDNQRKTISRTGGDAAVLLMEHYLRKVHRTTADLRDSTVAEELDWDVSKVKRNRLKLAKLGLFAKERYSHHGRTTLRVYLMESAGEYLQRLAHYKKTRKSG